eukprot:11864960-Alexandrium_andersonii.AAC.1
MSASLVGSEMCIRDRTFATGTSKQRQQNVGTGTGTRAIERVTLPRAMRSCLLYTSDAADDM